MAVGAQLILKCQNKLGEEAIWDDENQILYWVDTISPSAIHSYSPQTGAHQKWVYDEPLVALAIHKNGNLLVAGAKAIREWSPQLQMQNLVTHIETAQSENRINCMACDPNGNLWVATMQNNVTPEGEPKQITGYFGALYRVSPNGEIYQFANGFACPNTLLWSPDGKYFYIAESANGWIYRYDFDSATGTISHKTEFFHSPENGIPDGSAIDQKGNIWNARWGANCVLQISPDGELLQKIDLDASQPTSCAFGEKGQRVLYVTSARFGLDGSAISENDGAIFAIKTDIGGAAIHKFGAG